MVLTFRRIARTAVVLWTVIACSPTATAPMVLANDYDVELVVRIIGADGEFSDVAVPAHSQRNLEPSSADVAYLVVFDEECETRTIITFGDGAPSFSSGGVITMDPVGLGGYEPGVFRPAGTAAQPNGACANALTPPRPT